MLYNCRKINESKALTYRDIIIHGKNILIKAFIQSFTPKNWQKIHRRNWTVNHQRLPWKQEACPVNVHKSCDTVTMNVNKDRRRGFGPRTPHSSWYIASSITSRLITTEDASRHVSSVLARRQFQKLQSNIHLWNWCISTRLI